MSPSETTPGPVGRVGYVLKMYPRFSETFIVNEVLAQEAAGTEMDIFSLRPPRGRPLPRGARGGPCPGDLRDVVLAARGGGVAAGP